MAGRAGPLAPPLGAGLPAAGRAPPGGVAQGRAARFRLQPFAQRLGPPRGDQARRRILRRVPAG
jgi:hypothetical protein